MLFDWEKQPLWSLGLHLIISINELLSFLGRVYRFFVAALVFVAFAFVVDINEILAHSNNWHGSRPLYRFYPTSDWNAKQQQQGAVWLSTWLLTLQQPLN